MTRAAGEDNSRHEKNRLRVVYRHHNGLVDKHPITHLC